MNGSKFFDIANLINQLIWKIRGSRKRKHEHERNFEIKFYIDINLV